MAGRQFITMLKSFPGSGGTTRMLAGTRGRLYQSTGDGGNWRLLLSAGPQDVDTEVPWVRWRCATIGNLAIFVNGETYPYWTAYEAVPSEDTGMTAQLADEFVALGITSVRVIGAWQGFVFYANIVQEGLILRNRVLWSDFNDPLAITPGAESVAGYTDLDADEEVVDIAQLGSRCMLYTTKSIYAIRLVGGDEVFNFERVYSGPLAIRFPNSLINMGDQHVYASDTDLVVMREFWRSPETMPYLTAAAGAIYKGLPADLLEGLESSGLQSFGPVNRAFCHAMVGGYDEANQIAWMSWPSEDDTSGIPSQSIAIQHVDRRACLVDHGFTAFCSHMPSDGLSLRKWLADVGACEPIPVVGEGNPDYGFEGDQDLRWIRNLEEDPDGDPDEDSLCRKLELNPDLEPDCTPCKTGWWFLMASAAEMRIVRYRVGDDRQRCTDAGTPIAWTEQNHPTSSATYVEDGFVSVLQGDALTYGRPGNKQANLATVHGDMADAPDTPAATRPTLHCRVGVGAQAGKILWFPSNTRPLDLLSSTSNADHKTAKTRPNTPPTFPFFRTGSHVAWRIMIADPDGEPVASVDAAINNMTVRITGTHHDWHWP